ncbi:hypothetical protein HS048_25890 [Planomonospora sp. ID91781]|uniref:hypothetical protein n=1 Tax=Planomonospora sp. ID91781 TaxID=2738135 RepID=UPI0018C3947F|nr:hypothetical protein [Planomonospora sp. ID91781]MBG0824144.1 hypothetical protein [Planomonospora sp. ID91781]
MGRTAGGPDGGESGSPDSGTAPDRGEQQDRASSDFARLWHVLANVVAPTTLVTSLMVYFGWVQSNIVYGAFGMDQSVLRLSLQDYMFRSVGATMEPLAWLLFAIVVLVPLHVLFVRLLSGHRAVARWVVPAVAAVGFVLCLVWIIGGTGVFRSALPIVPMSLGLGVMLLGYAVHLHAVVVHRRIWPSGESPALRIVGRVSFAGLLLLTLLWSAAVYAQIRGAGMAGDLLADSRRLPGVVVYAPDRLRIEGPGVVERELRPSPGEKPRYRYRYDGLRLLIRADRHYFLLPVCWTVGGDSRAIALPEDPAVRLEFFRLPREYRSTCPAAPPPGSDLPPPPSAPRESRLPSPSPPG